MENEKEMHEEAAVNEGATALNMISWLFGIVAFAIGVVNTFWGNDPGFGIFIVLLSLVYFLPVHALLNKMTGLTVPGTVIRVLKIFLGFFILWAALGVGELFDKIELMLRDF
ncbi:hypothetical protein GCM10023188_33790 [Pontibacter saemangeumensis]|uniref:Cytochrome C oxidase subunit IV n=1 Tax=Pontibacter saemangeumensis TaxID=1084525 RepID=A0ABP8LW20_9BACT